MHWVTQKQLVLSKAFQNYSGILSFIFVSLDPELTFKCRQASALELCKEGSSGAGEERVAETKLLD